jgi:DNA-binding CsgD family transcriptional regulator
MVDIGFVKREPNGAYTGELRTLTISSPIEILPDHQIAPFVFSARGISPMDCAKLQQAIFEKPMNDDQKLSRRQLECLEGVARGETSAEIANALGVSRRTIDHYVADTCVRLGVRNRTQAVAKAIVEGLIERPR